MGDEQMDSEAQEKQEEEVFHIRRLFVEYDKESFISEGFTLTQSSALLGLGVKNCR